MTTNSPYRPDEHHMERSAFHLWLDRYLDHCLSFIVLKLGAGKTTLATALGKILNLPVYFEPVIDNEYLADFYQEPAKYSFALQVSIISESDCIANRLC